MKSVRGRFLPVVFAVTALTLGVCCLFVFAKLEGVGRAEVVYVGGFADAKLKETGETVALVRGMKVGEGDEITTDSESSVELKLFDGSMVKIGPDSRVVIKEMGQVEVTKVGRSRFELIGGKIRAVVKPFLDKESKFTIETENATIGVRGTDFGVSFDLDQGSTDIISIEDCVFVVANKFPGLYPIEVCTMQELLISGSDLPGVVSGVDREKLKGFLEEMEFKGEEGTTETGGEIEPPEITSAILNNRINLEDLEDVLTLTRNDLGLNGGVSITGTAEDGKYRITKVEVTTDGGMTWSPAAGTDRWTFAFKPNAGTEYELMIRATNEKGVISDPEDFGSFTVKYVDVSYEDIAREFIESFFRYVKSSDTTGLGDLISDSYDGRAADAFTKDELLDDNLEEFFNLNQDFTIGYSINQVNYDGKSIIVSTSWNASIEGVSSSGTTKWWLSQSENYNLVHTEGGWFVTPEYLDEPELIIELVESGDPLCTEAVKIILVAPKISGNVKSVEVKFETYCSYIISKKYIKLTRSFYESETGKSNGFGSIIAIFDNTTCIVAPPCPGLDPIIYSTTTFPDRSLKVYFDKYGYNLYELFMMP